MLWILGFLSWLVPKVVIPWEKGPAALFPISHDQAVCEQYHSDPLVYHGGLRPRFSLQLLTSMMTAKERAAEFNVPYLCIHGSDDRMCLPVGSEIWHNKTSSKDKTRILVNGCFHEVEA